MHIVTKRSEILFEDVFRGDKIKEVKSALKIAVETEFQDQRNFRTREGRKTKNCGVAFFFAQPKSYEE
jgi:hypothetical protein